MMITNNINMLGVGMLRKKVLVNSSTFSVLQEAIINYDQIFP